MSVNTQSNSDDSGTDVPATSYGKITYIESNKKAFGSQQEVADAWSEGKFPTHNMTEDGSAVLYSGTPQSRRSFGDANWSDEGRRPDEARGFNTNFYAVQNPDGSGTLWHYTTRECIRLEDGTVINNQQCWSTGFAHCSVPDDVDYNIPLSAVEEHLNSEDGVRHINGVLGQPESYQRETYDGEIETVTSNRAKNSIVIIAGEKETYGIYLGRDPSIINGESNFSFRLTKDQVQDCDSPSDALDLLTPNAVEKSDMEVVDSAEFTKSRLSEEELEAHTNCGGHTSESNSSWRDHQINRQQYRADLQGKVIVRHGEFFFIPRPDLDEVHEQGTSEAAEFMGNHRAMRFHGARMPLPTECENCGESDIDLGEHDDTETRCNSCGEEIERSVFTRGQISHATNDHNSVNLGETWHEVVRHDADVMLYDDNPVEGNGGGWD